MEHPILKMFFENVAKPFLGNEKLTVLLVTLAISGWGIYGYGYFKDVPEIKTLPINESPSNYSVIEEITCPKVVCGCKGEINKHEKGDQH